jgi:ribosome maturation factor RimP
MASSDLPRAEIPADVERAVTSQLPDVEVVDVQLSASSLRVLIDHPGGVDHELCTTVTNVLRPYLDRFTLEVSSPGIPRPLIRPAHFRRFVGHEISVRTHEPVEGRKSFVGVLRDADDDRIVIEPDDEQDTLEIPFGLVRKSHLVEEI